MTNLTGLLFNSGIVDSMPLVLAQYSSSSSEEAAVTGASLVINALSALFGLASFIFGGYVCNKIYTEMGMENAWMAWIPILGWYPTFEAADEENPVLWTILMCIPCVNIVAGIKWIIAWANISQKREKTPWVLLAFFFVPFVGQAIWWWYVGLS